jgi:hypothetical protein
MPHPIEKLTFLTVLRRAGVKSSETSREDVVGVK